MNAALASEVAADRFDGDFDSEILKRSPLSVFTCPDCGGALWEVRDGEMNRFRCHIGHAFSAETLSGRKDDGIDHALLVALRTLEEQGVLYRRMAERARDGAHLQLAERYARRADQREREADSVRGMQRSPRRNRKSPLTRRRDGCAKDLWRPGLAWVEHPAWLTRRQHARDARGSDMMSVADSTTPVLVVDDDRDSRNLAREVLQHGGIGPVSMLQSGDEIAPWLEQNHCSLMLLDLGLPKAGPDLIQDIASAHPDTSIVVVSGKRELDIAVRCLRQGAYDYVTKPFAPTRLVEAARSALGRKPTPPAAQLVPPLRRPTSEQVEAALTDILTADPVMQGVFAYLRQVAPTGQPVLISGETGTGKDLVARAIHRLSARPGEFVAVNVAGFDDAMFSDTLFGHRKGAFTGATDPRPGLVLRASSGTLFLDEVGDLPIPSQVKLLRLLQDGDYFPLGCDQPKTSSARVVVATSVDLRERQEAGAFRADLFYRLCTHQVRLPPLRDRKGDVPLLLDRFVRRACMELNRPRLPVPPEALALLAGYRFPGNVRELRALAYDCVARTPDGSPLMLEPIAAVVRLAERVRLRARSLGFADELPSLREAQDLLVDEALRRTKGNQARAAALLGVTRQAMNRRVRARERQAPVEGTEG